MKQAYYGHDSQLFGVEEVRLTGGRGDGMRLLQVRNGMGLEFTISADRCCDISRLSFKGDNYSLFSAGGYAAPAYYDDKADGWLKGFTAGFLTTCGLTTFGSPGEDAGEQLPLHGNIAHVPAERVSWDMDDEAITIKAVMNDARVFSRKLILTRTIVCSKVKNEVTITDCVENQGHVESPFMMLYHMNMGYPLLSETSELYIPSDKVTPRNAHAAADLATWNRVLPPTAGFEEQCYLHDFKKHGRAAIFNKEIDKGLLIEFDPAQLDHFVQWKMMGARDYVMGLEPGNGFVDGRAASRANGALKFIAPGESKTHQVKLSMVNGAAQWESVKKA